MGKNPILMQFICHVRCAGKAKKKQMRRNIGYTPKENETMLDYFIEEKEKFLSLEMTHCGRCADCYFSLFFSPCSRISQRSLKNCYLLFVVASFYLSPFVC